MKAKQLIDTLRSQLTQELQAKTGWGRNEVLQAFERAATATLGELVEITNSDDPVTSRTCCQAAENGRDCNCLPTCKCGPTECCGLCE